MPSGGGLGSSWRRGGIIISRHGKIYCVTELCSRVTSCDEIGRVVKRDDGFQICYTIIKSYSLSGAGWQQRLIVSSVRG